MQQCIQSLDNKWTNITTLLLLLFISNLTETYTPSTGCLCKRPRWDHSNASECSQSVEGTCLQFTPANPRAAGAHLGNEDGKARPCECEQNNKVLGPTLLFKVKRTKGLFSSRCCQPVWDWNIKVLTVKLSLIVSTNNKPLWYSLW